MNFLGKFITKTAIPFIVSNIELDIDTIEKESGKFLRARIQLLGYILLDRIIPLESKKPVDIYAKALKDPRLRELEKMLNKKIKNEA